jgi:multidrug transporter EmrE-like cation transporter
VVVVGLVLAALSAAASNVGFLLRHRGAVAAPDVDARHLLRSAADLFRSKWWTIGFAVAFLAYALHVGALALAPLSLVQAVLAGGIVLLGVIAERFFGCHLGGREWAGISLVALGLTFLALTGESKSGQASAEYSVGAMIAFEGGLVGLGTLLILAERSPRAAGREGPLLGVAAGLLFTVTHVAIKATTGRLDTTFFDVVTSPYLLVAIAGGVAAFFISARSLQFGPAVAVIALTSIASNASAIPAGIVVFGDPLGHGGFSVALRSLAFVMVVVAAALIPAPVRAAREEQEAAPRREVEYAGSPG